MTKSIPLKIGCLILDMDGVLVDTEPLHIEAFARYMDELGIAYRREYIHGFVGYSIEDNVRRINRELLPGREVDVAEGVRQRDRIYLDLLRSTSLQPMPGIRELVAFCREKGWQVALASSSSRE
ncbi:MAG TPA: HAD family phosphatase, partial [Caldithrix abyssi]|nr:HAD family phosphatase [Caldithrix abyssi]